MARAEGLFASQGSGLGGEKTQLKRENGRFADFLEFCQTREKPSSV